jgi:hypothetical protein
LELARGLASRLALLDLVGVGIKVGGKVALNLG